MEKKNIFKTLFAKENIFYTMIFIVMLAIVVINRAINGFDNILWLCDLASIFSALNVIFCAKHSIWGLIFNFIATVILAVTDIFQHIWLNAFICAAINAPMLLYGIIRWRKNANTDSSKNLNVLSKKGKVLVWGGFALCSALFTLVLKLLGGNLFVFDAIYSSGCVFGVILCSFAFIDQFLVFNFANIFGLTMYILLTIQNINNLTMIFTVIVFILVDIIGYLNWRKIIKAQKTETAQTEQIETKEVEQ